MRKITVTQIRLPAGMHEFIQQEAERTGISQNALMLMLMELGKRVYDDPAIRQNVTLDAEKIGICPQQDAGKIRSARSCSGFPARQ